MAQNFTLAGLCVTTRELWSRERCYCSAYAFLRSLCVQGRKVAEDGDSPAVVTCSSNLWNEGARERVFFLNEINRSDESDRLCHARIAQMTGLSYVTVGPGLLRPLSPPPAY